MQASGAQEARGTKRLYAKLADALSKSIVGDKYAVGDRLPSERDLAAKFKVSRPIVREAIFALEAEGLVEVRTGSGVYVKSKKLGANALRRGDVGMFELLEARRAFEGETAALAATRITAEEIAELRRLVAEMSRKNASDIEMSEDADMRFHLVIATATRNPAILQTIESYWQARRSSAQTQYFLKKVRSLGVAPNILEHSEILAALEQRDPVAARAAMRDHLTAVIEAVLKATEVETMERAQAELSKNRALYLEGN
ncbi:MAG: FadR/GntR family transcriptional regulator [Bryobacteraceae bacterium]